jgi:Tify domain binding domain
LRYITKEGDVLRRGVVVLNHNGITGILCDCCSMVISCSAFEAHAGKLLLVR